MLYLICFRRFFSWSCVLVCLLLSSAFAQPGAWVPHPMEDIPASVRPAFSPQPSPMVLVGPRNGFASGQVVLRDVDVQQIVMEDLVNQAGGRFPARLIDVNFMVREIPERNWSSDRFQGILPELPRRVSAEPFLPVHLSTRIPPQTPPGIYRGFLRAGALRVPVELRVPEFVIPSPRDWQTWVHLVHLPEAVALMYGEEIWSDGHFERLVPSLQRLAEVGNNVFHIPVERSTHLGNDHGMLVFREEGGRYVPDFQFVERFLRLIHEHNGPPRVLWLYIFEPRQGPHRAPTMVETRITTINRQGRLGEAVIPSAGVGPADETWRAVIQGMRQRVQALGWDPNIVMVGAAADQRPEPHMVNFFNAFDPPVRWVVFSHWRGDPRHGDRPVIIDHGLSTGFAEIPDILDIRSQFRRDLLGGSWGSDPVVPWITSFRGSAGHDSDLIRFRYMPDLSVHGRFGGFGRQGLDGWRVRDPESGQMRSSWMRQNNAWFRLVRSNTGELTVPGPDGAAPSLRFAQIREGQQEAEARITLERVIRERKSPSLEREIREFLSDWNQTRYFSAEGMRFRLLDDWADRNMRLFELAHRAQEALGETVSPAAMAPVAPVAGPVQREPEPLAPIDPELTVRTWTSADGREIEAGFIAYDAEGVKLALPGNRTVTVQPENLSEADVAWVREQAGYRLWTNRQGQTVEARLMAYDGRDRFILRNRFGNQVTLSLADFIDEDQEVIRAFEP
jgi:hypothetical protein